MTDINTEDNDILCLLEERIREADRINDFFEEQFEFADKLCGGYRFIKRLISKYGTEDRLLLAGKINSDEKDELVSLNAALFGPVLKENYGKSYTDPSYAAGKFGKTRGQLVSAVAAELRAAIPAVYECDAHGLVMRLELLLEVYTLFETAAEDEKDVDDGQLKTAFYDYVFDYMDTELAGRTAAQLVPGALPWPGRKIAAPADDTYLYFSGEYISENELKMYDFLQKLPEGKLRSMADTFTDGYIKGFEVTGRDLSKKETAEQRFNIGFLPMMEIAAENLERKKIKTSAMRAGYSIFTGRNVDKNGFYGGNPNPQFDLDHKNDMALILDEKLNARRIEALTAAYEENKTAASKYAGPACVDIFGEEQFEPEEKENASNYSDENRNLVTEYAATAGKIINDYIPGDERSFTIIAFPLPSIGPDFEAILEDTIRINTLDYELYRKIQQNIIDTLDKASYVYVKGMGDNKTDLKVALHLLTDPGKQTNFENCVADVNIPVGEVFTSPVLKNTCGTLNVCRVFLNGIEYRNLTISVKDGMTADYGCDNFNDKNGEIDTAAGRKLMEENILFHHDSLPMGECAIGTNTTAYEVARRYGIEAKMPILIAEKTGPHFAFGDTCYSHCEDLNVYNPDGKEIIARENECSAKRKSDPKAAYFNCHTDITIPYDELGELSAEMADGTRIPIILQGRFVLPGCEELNIPLDGH